MKKIFIITFLMLSVYCFGQDDKKGTIKVKKPVSKELLIVEDVPVNGVYSVVDQMPVFAGGNENMYLFIQKNIKYPKKEKEEGVQGTVYVTFVVGEDGTISNVRILRGVNGGTGCDMEAMRVVMMMPKWTAGKNKGKAVAVQCNLPIKFKL